MSIDLPERIGTTLADMGGFLRCETCSRQKVVTSDMPGRYLATGWPKCHGYTMSWWTRRQIEAVDKDNQQ